MSVAALRPPGLSAAAFVYYIFTVLRSAAAPKPTVLGAVALTRYSTYFLPERRGLHA